MGQVTLSGASDDLIEVDGDIREEFNYLKNDEDDGAVLGFSDGTVLRIKFDADGDGNWRITPLIRGTAVLEIEQTTGEDGTDVATLDGEVGWVVHGLAYAKKK